MTASVIVEMLPRLQACNVFMISKAQLDSHEAIKIKIKSTSFEIEWLCSNIVNMQEICLTGYTLVPNSLSSLQVHGNSVAFRLQTRPLNIAGSFKTEIIANEEKFSVSAKLIPTITANKPCNITCRCCGNSILRAETMFKRVLPLPSASWEHGDWFCHKHGDSPECAETKSPGLDCLYGSGFISIPLTLTNISTKSVAVCPRCRSWLGTCDERTVKLWTCTVSCIEPVQSCSALDHFVIVVKEAIHSSIGMLCRLIVETKISIQETHYLLLWVMDKDLTLLVDIADKTGSKCQLLTKQTMKVLYAHEMECSPVVKSWQNDVNVQHLDVAKPMFTVGLKYMVDATQLIPPKHRVANGFYVSYLGIF